MIYHRYTLLILALAVFIGIIWLSDPIKLVEVISGVDRIFLLYAFIASNIALFTRIVKWKVLTNFSFGEIVPVQILGMTIGNFTPGKIAEPVKVIILKLKTGAAVSSVLPSVAWERVLDVVVLIVMSMISLHIISSRTQFFLASSLIIGVFFAIVVLVLLIIYNKKIGTRIFDILGKFPLMKSIGKDFVETFYKRRIQKRKIFYSFIATSVAWLIDGFIIYILLLSLGIDSSPFLLSGIVALSILIGIASSLPGGIGSSEFVMILLLGVLGISTHIAVAITIVARFMTFWYPALLGGVSFFYLGRKIDMNSIKSSFA